MDQGPGWWTRVQVDGPGPRLMDQGPGWWTRVQVDGPGSRLMDQGPGWDTKEGEEVEGLGRDGGVAVYCRRFMDLLISQLKIRNDSLCSNKWRMLKKAVSSVIKC